MAVQEPKWLIKTGGVITGPFSTLEVENKVSTRQIVAHDEVTQPDKPWLFIRDIPVFKKAIDSSQVQKKHTVNENTATLITTVVAHTVTDAVPQNMDELTPSSLTPPKFIKDAIKTVIGVDKKAEDPAHLKSYGVVDNQLVKTKALEQSKFSRNLLAICIAAVAVFYAYNEYLKKPVVNLATTTNEITLAMTAIRVGDSAAALEHLSKAKEAENNLQAVAYYNLLLLKERPQLAAQVLQNTSELSASDKSLREMYLIRALAHVLLKRFNDAKVDLKSAAIAETKQVALKSGVQINLNEAIIDYLSGSYEEARQKLMLINADSNRSIKQILMTLISLKSNAGASNKTKLTELAQRLESQIKTNSNWRFETALLKAYVLSLLGDANEFDKFSYSLLEFDPDLTTLHWQDPWISSKVIADEIYNQWCGQLISTLSNSARKSMIQAYCFYKQGKEQAAQNMADQALAKAPKDPLINAWYAVIFRDTGFEGKAGEHFAKSDQYNEGLPEKDKHWLPWTLHARWLEIGKDYQIASQLWIKVISRDAESVSALTGRARYMLETGNLDEAKDIASKAKERSADYIPLLKLTYEIEGKSSL